VGKLPSLTGKEVIKVLEKIGYIKLRQKGSHVILKKDRNNLIVVPLHSGE